MYGSAQVPSMCHSGRLGAYVVLDWRALAGESATEEGPQEGIENGRHSIGMDGFLMVIQRARRMRPRGIDRTSRHWVRFPGCVANGCLFYNDADGRDAEDEGAGSGVK